jgi:hypothetical protein
MTINLYSPFENGNKSTASVSVLRDKDGGEWRVDRKSCSQPHLLDCSR